MSTSKQRREAARRHLERQLQRRQQRELRRRRFVLLASIIGSVVVIAAIVVAVTVLGSGSSTKAASTPTDSGVPVTTAPAEHTTGPCDYTQSLKMTSNYLKNVGVPPDPSPTPTQNRTMTIKTNKGQLTIALDAALAPCNVQSIAYLASKGFYDNTSCHRLTTSGIYVLQCGDPSGTGQGGPSYTVKDENLTKANYTTGVVAMANSGADTNGSQFFIIYKDSTSLPKNYAQIGTVTQGMDIVQQVAAAGSDNSNGDGDGKPKQPLTFQTVTVVPPVTGSGSLVPVSAAPVPSESASGSVPGSAGTGSPDAGTSGVTASSAAPAPSAVSSSPSG